MEEKDGDNAGLPQTTRGHQIDWTRAVQFFGHELIQRAMPSASAATVIGEALTLDEVAKLEDWCKSLELQSLRDMLSGSLSDFPSGSLAEDVAAEATVMAADPVRLTGSFAKTSASIMLILGLVLALRVKGVAIGQLKAEFTETPPELIVQIIDKLSGSSPIGNIVQKAGTQRSSVTVKKLK